MTIILIISLTSCQSEEVENKYDIVVYGGTSAGISAAIQSSRMGKSVVLIEPTQKVGGLLGGLTTGGLGATDIGNKQAIGGISREFYERIAKKYADQKAWKFEKREDYIKKETLDITPSMWTFEPKIAKEVFTEMLEEHHIKVFYNERLDLNKQVTKENGAIIKIIIESGKEFHGRMFIDATYEGDLMAKSGVSYIVGRESNAQYRETLNGVQKALGKFHQFLNGVDPYIIENDSTSGLLSNVNRYIQGRGSADERVQGYCFRMCLTDVLENRVLVKKPQEYNESEYELLFRAIEAGYKGPFFIMSKMPNRKTDSNNKGPFSSDYIGNNFDYPEGDYQTRERIIKEHEIFQKGLL